VIELNNHLERVPSDNKETVYSGRKRASNLERRKTIPTSGEISLFIIAFL
jgi:hypothetical protein